MRIVHVEDFFHPDAGYQINIIPKYMAKQGNEVFIVTSKIEDSPKELTSFFGDSNIYERDQIYFENTGVKILRVKAITFISGRSVFGRKLFETVDNLNPDVTYVHGNDTLTAMQYLMKYKKKKFPLVMDSHMLEMASINKFNKVFRYTYRKVFTPIITKNMIPIIRTQDDPYVKKHLGIPLNLAPWISVGSDTLLFHENKEIRREFREAHKISDEDFVVVYTGKLDEAKGAKLLAEAFFKKFSNDKRNIVLLVVGNSNGEYGEEVERMFESSENRVLRFSTQKYTDLARFYQASDLSIFPRQCSLSFFDAQACGLPVISEDNNINKERLKHENGFTFRSNDAEDFRRKILDSVEMSLNDYNLMRKNASLLITRNYDYKAQSLKYMQILKKEYERLIYK